MTETDNLIVKVQFIHESKYEDNPKSLLHTRVYCASSVERIDAIDEPPILNFWVRLDTPEGPTRTLHQAIVNGEKGGSEYSRECMAAWVETQSGARVEALYPPHHPKPK